MELHFPYYELKEVSSTSSTPRERQIDVAFLNSDSICPQHSSKYGIYAARFSLLISGRDHVRWTAHAFFDHANAEELYEDDCEHEEDPIASPLEADQNSVIVSANRPIYNPREYYLRVLETRSATIVVQWRAVVSWLEHKTREYVCPNICSDNAPIMAVEVILKQHVIRRIGNPQAFSANWEFSKATVQKTTCSPLNGRRKCLG